MLGRLELVPTYAWSRLDLRSGLGLVRLETEHLIQVEGYEIAVNDQQSWAVTFQVRLDSAWRTRYAEIVVVDDQGSRQVSLEANGEGNWYLNGTPAAELDGCLDVDIAATPFTNTFVIRRLELPVGEVGEVRVAWVSVPSLEVAAMDQTYVHLEQLDGRDRYEYRSGSSEDGWNIEVDEDGVVLDYEGFAHRLHPKRAVV